MLKILAVMAIFVSSVAIAKGGNSEEIPTISPSLTVLPAAMVAEEDRLFVLGDNAVVTGVVAAQYSRPESKPESTLHVVQDPVTEDYGITDGRILIHLHSANSLQGLAADYGLTVYHTFSAVPMGVLTADSIAAATSHVNALRDDPRVISAELDVSYFRQRTQ